MAWLRSRSALFWSLALGLLLAGLAFGGMAEAQSVSIDVGEEDGLTERVIQLVILLTVLSLAPSILIMTTSFVRIIVVLSLLRTAVGLQQSPPNAVLVSLALFLTAFIMAPVFTQAYGEGIQPYLDGQIETEEAFERTTSPVKMFMLAHTREDDLALFFDIAQVEVETPEATPLHVVAPAFMISELRRAFEIGFLLFIPFLIIDLVVASILMSMGMMMLPPVIISLPFKLIFFVLVDGWRLVTGSLVESFQTGVPGG
ncbi:MAG TPA: flagellar biosynthetic protein FliP [Oceanicaulis sp.]|uniref:Flagellar biosynthetic protein FliP n=1 Tax=Glycocaulis albus TaxID=1382801 RepID=A0ABQ1XU12_9PROT|nr:flagellar type III secretion system pore protein FliP [Glycocaulis albus]MBV5258800.1 flagellar type III secretion system pore protein FliP [Synechococcus moorigangaii CMS01]GGH02823.1 flagellar biosynthetic protein FliP [Glycocaulis albus]HCY57043.1 flagellar biosynthetic protein FliP [Oceanicaulis sp.]